MFDLTRRLFLLAGGAALVARPLAAASDPVETSFLAPRIASGELPPVAQRLPLDPLVVDLAAKGRAFGTPGGSLRTMVTRDKDIRQMVVYGYARLVGYDADYRLVADILRDFEVEGDRVFTLHLRRGHRWSDGAPFTTEDIRYWWEDVALNPELSPAGPPDFLIVDGAPPRVEFIDALSVRFSWDKPNPNFLQTLAAARPPFIYRPAHVLRNFHVKYADPAALETHVRDHRVKSWAALHNKLDNMYKFDNSELPTLQPWVNATEGKRIRHIFARNPFYHRVDTHGQQLPYIDTVEMEVVSGGLVAAKSNAGETDLQARGLDFSDIPILKKGEAENGTYRTLLWRTGVASQIAIYPNLNYNDPVWRAALRDVRVRRALSLGIDRKTINQALFFKLAQPAAMSVLPESPFFDPAHRDAYAAHDLETANALLDAAGLARRPGDGLRQLPDGRPCELVVETAGERQEVENALQIITDTWAEIGIKLVMRPLDRDILRNRVFAGTTMASVWYGWDNGIPQPYTSPAYLAPTDQVFLAWPKWGQHYQTGGSSGELPDLPEAQRLMALLTDWEAAADDTARSAAWREMLAIHADQVYGIGILNQAPQPVVVNRRLQNVPETAMWAWDPGAHFGIHRPDEFFFAD